MSKDKRKPTKAGNGKTSTEKRICSIYLDTATGEFRMADWHHDKKHQVSDRALQMLAALEADIRLMQLIKVTEATVNRIMGGMGKGKIQPATSIPSGVLPPGRG